MSRGYLFGLVVLCLAGCMEQSKPQPVARTPSLYTRLGGEEGISKVVDDFVTNVLAEEKIREVHKKHFRTGDVAGLKRKLIDQIGEATGGPQTYTGKNMKDAHEGMGITNADFDALVAALVKALDKNQVGKGEQKELLTLLGNMRGEVIEKAD
jgi:hemoglobin